MKIHDHNDPVFSTPSKVYAAPGDIPAEATINPIKMVSSGMPEINITLPINITLLNMGITVTVSGKLINTTDMGEGTLEFCVNSVSQGAPLSAPGSKQAISNDLFGKIIYDQLNEQFARFFWQPVIVNADSIEKIINDNINNGSNNQNFYTTINQNFYQQSIKPAPAWNRNDWNNY